MRGFKTVYLRVCMAFMVMLDKRWWRNGPELQTRCIRWCTPQQPEPRKINYTMPLVAEFAVPEKRHRLVHGARSVLRIAEAKEKTDTFSRWAREVAKHRGRHKAVLAIANKMARIGWVVLAKELHYDPQLL